MRGSEVDKLAELRARTDRQLIALIDWMLDLGLRLACDGNSGRAKAERACAEAERLLPAVYNLSETERRRLESKMLALQERLARCVTAAA